MLKKIKKNKNIIVLGADKSKSTVIFKKAEYIEKMEIELEKPNYLELEENPIDNVVKKLKKLVTELRRDKKLGEEFKKISKIQNRTPQMYGIVKVHKEGHPLRP